MSQIQNEYRGLITRKFISVMAQLVSVVRPKTCTRINSRRYTKGIYRIDVQDSRRNVLVGILIFITIDNGRKQRRAIGNIKVSMDSEICIFMSTSTSTTRGVPIFSCAWASRRTRTFRTDIFYVAIAIFVVTNCS